MYSSILFDSIYFGYIAKAISVALITSCWGQKAVGTNYYCDNNAYSLISKDCFILKIRLNGAFLLIDAVFLLMKLMISMIHLLLQAVPQLITATYKM